MNNKELAILGLLGENPKYGYQLEADIEARGMREWTEIGFSSIYYLLKKTEKLGWTTGVTTHSDEGPSRKVYSLTTKGLGALQAAILHRLGDPKLNSGDFQLALAFIPIPSPEDTDRALSRYKQRLEQDLARVKDRSISQSPLPAHVNTLFEYDLQRMQNELKWLNQFLDQRKVSKNG